jgi:carboxymethylenebutenolidase
LYQAYDRDAGVKDIKDTIDGVRNGGDTEKYLGEAGGLTAPLLMHLAKEDEFISKAAQAEIRATLAKNSKATVYSYPSQNHAFSRHGGAHYNAEAAALAHERTYAFLNRQIRCR